MPLFHIIILSLVQGLTEFLPISSSGHLVLVPHFLGWKDQGCLMDVAVHVGTLGSVLLYFWRDVWSMVPGFFALVRGKITKGGQLFLLLCIGTVPAVIFGFLLKRYGLDHVRTLKVIAWTMIGYGILLYIADKFSPATKGMKDVTAPKAFFVGVAQALALIPGTSRSGACMTMMRFMGFTRADAAKFSFLLSIPSIIAAATLTTIDAIKEGAFASSVTHDVAIAVGVSFVAGILAINFMLTWLKSHDFTPFVVYRLGLGGLLLYMAYGL